MTETILALIPDYGLILVFAVVFLASFGLPLPASMLVLAAGGFAAAGDLAIWAVWGTALAGFLAGDLCAYTFARIAGPSLLSRLTHITAIERMMERARTLLHRRGGFAVFLSHTVVSPAGPWVTYLSGIGRLKRRIYAAAAVPGATLWSGFYSGIGYSFASNLAELSTLVGNITGMIAAGAGLLVSALWVIRRWKQHLREIATA